MTDPLSGPCKPLAAATGSAGNPVAAYDGRRARVTAARGQVTRMSAGRRGALPSGGVSLPLR